MPYLSNITHPNKNIETKVNYFCDYFTLSNMHLGRLPRFRMDCPSYLFHSILFQLDNNRDKCSPYIYNLIKSLSKQNLDLIEAIVMNKRRMNRLYQITQLSNKLLGKEIKSNFSSFRRFINNMYEVIKKEELSKVINIVTRFLRCKHKLNYHINELEHLAKVLVSIFRYEGFTRQESTLGFSSIFSKSIYNFPFPFSINQIEDDELRRQEKERFIKERNFNQQFKAIQYAVKRKKVKLNFIAKIINIKPDVNKIIDFNYNGYRVISQNHPLIEEIKSVIRKVEVIKDFFSSDTFLIVIFEMETLSNARENRVVIWDKLIDLCRYINFKLSNNNATPDLHLYFNTPDFKKIRIGLSSQDGISIVDDFDLENLKDNAFDHLENINSSLKAKLLYFEDQYWSAIAENNMVRMWQYLENITPVDSNGNRFIRRTVKSILLHNFKQLVEENYQEDFINLINDFHPQKRTEFHPEEVMKIRRREYHTIDYRRL